MSPAGGLSTPADGPSVLLLDLDGTLADSLGVMRQTYANFLARFGVQATDAEFESLNGPPLGEVVRRLRDRHRLAGEPAALLALYNAEIDHAYLQVATHPGALALLKLAREHHCWCGVVTSNSAVRTDAWLREHELRGLVDGIVAADDVQRGKPDPEPYRLAMARSGRSAGRMVAVEDSPQGAHAARAAGLETFVLDHAGAGAAWPQGCQPVRSLKTLAGLLWPRD